VLTLSLTLLAATAPCRANVTEVFVDTTAHHMWLCEKGAPKGDYRVALGSGGTGKQVEGDAKTPLGIYPLAEPRGSDKFHTFILLGYPTAEQKAKGMTGSDVGVHGPARGFENSGALNVATDWTLGCIAVESDAYIDTIAAWVKRAKCGTIRLE